MNILIHWFIALYRLVPGTWIWLATTQKTFQVLYLQKNLKIVIRHLMLPVIACHLRLKVAILLQESAYTTLNMQDQVRHMYLTMEMDLLLSEYIILKTQII